MGLVTISDRIYKTVSDTAVELGMSPGRFVEILLIARVAEEAVEKELYGKSGTPYVDKDVDGNALTGERVFELMKKHYYIKMVEQKIQNIHMKLKLGNTVNPKDKIWYMRMREKAKEIVSLDDSEIDKWIMGEIGILGWNIGGLGNE